MALDLESTRLLAKGISTITMGASAIGEGYLIGKTMEAIGRNPKLEGTLFTKMLIGVALAESTAIYALVAFFII
mgnify:CR=1 FL=1